jgi:O-succinylbenzoic acid--CoA ligase
MRELSIFAAADEAPNRDCVVDGQRTYSFMDVAGLVAGELERLHGLGIAEGSYVALTPRADLDSIVRLFALFELGAPALLLHPRLTDPERRALLDDARTHRVLEDQTLPTPAPFPRRRVEQAPEQPLAIVYTSGTTAVARGAILSRRAFLASARAHAENLGWQDDDRWLLTMPPAHIGGLSILTRCLIARRCVVLAPGPFDAREVAEQMARERVTLLSVVPTMLRRLVDLPWHAHPELRAVLVGGATLPASLRTQATELGLPVLATYGCTEACSQVTTQSVDRSGASGSGSALRGIEVRTRHDEIQIRGEVLMDGYLDESSNADAWTDDGWFRTGDVGELDPDGQLHVHGRHDDRIVTGGENVAPLEVEAWLTSVPGVLSACVFGLPDEEWGATVAAALVVDTDVYDERALVDRAKRELASYKRPRSIALVESLSETRAGKLDRRATCERARPLLRAI